MKNLYNVIKLGLLVVFLGFGHLSIAQERTVSGKVVDLSEGSAIPGVNIVVKGKATGAVTNVDGEYQVQVLPEDVLVFSFVGYVTEEVAVGNQSVINVQLASNIKELQEIVVIGYGEVRKEDLTGSITTVSAKEFNKGAITSPQELLVGKTAGVVINPAGGAPGSSARIRIRGGSSLNASNDPLIIIDGIPVANNTIAGGNNILSIVNPNDIETMNILKDASATAIYGSRASNGVIIITTKKGNYGSPLQITYTGNTSISNAAKFVDVYSGDELRQLALDHEELTGVDGYDELWLENTNWQKLLFRTAVSHDHNLSVNGALKTMPYRVSFGYTDQQGIMKTTGMRRLTGSVNLSPSFFNEDLKLEMNAKGMISDHNYGDAGALGSAINMDPTKPVYDGNPETAGYFQWPTLGANLGTPNPVEQLMEVDNTSNVKRFIGNVLLTYRIPFLRELKANLNVGTDYTVSEGIDNRPTTSPSVLTSPLYGRLKDYDGTYYNNLLDFYLNYTKDLEGIKSRVDITGGYSWQHFKREETTFTRGYEDVEKDIAYQETENTFKPTENFLLSFFGRINYTLLDKYLLTLSIRNDGSSRFLEGHQWGLFPSAALAWKINEESFLKNSNTISDLKLRLGWGITGQQDISDTNYPAQAVYMTSSPGSYYIIGGNFIPTLRPNAYDPYIKWEETTTQNIGLDYGFINNRIYGSIDVYKRITEDLLNKITIPTGSNFSNTLVTNVGSLENTGIEVALNVIPISNQDMSLELGVNMSYNKNEITRLLFTDDPNFIGILYGDGMTGQKQVTRVGYPAYSFFVNKQVYDDDGYPIEGLYVDLSGEGGAVNGDNADKYIYNDPAPDYLMGFSARFNYKNFDLSASSRASIGNYMYNQVAAGASFDQMRQIGYWKNFPKYLDNTNFVKRQFTSDYFVEDASFFKLDYVSAGYRFENVIDKFNTYVSFTVQNVFTVTNYSGLDPESGDFSNFGIDNNFYPRPRTFTLGLSITY